MPYDPNFYKINFDQDPTWLVDLGWTTPAADFQLNETLLTNQSNHLTNNVDQVTPSFLMSNKSFLTNSQSFLTNNVDYITALSAELQYKIIQYDVHRSSISTFTPTSATLLATLTPGTAASLQTYQDTSDPIHDTDVFYKLESIFDGVEV